MNEPKTQNLGLNKIDRSSPSTTYFDLDKYLDQNWEKVDEGVATKQDLEELLEAVGEIDVPDASLTQKGKVQLSSKTDGLSETVAATEKAVRDVSMEIISNYVRQPGYARTTGTSSAYAAKLIPIPTNFADGFGITIVPHVTNGVAPTLNVNGLGAIPLKKQDGTAYSAGDLLAGKPYSFRRVGSDFLAVSGEREVIKGSIKSTALFTENISKGEMVSIVDYMRFVEVTEIAVGSHIEISQDGRFLVGYGGNRATIYLINSNGTPAFKQLISVASGSESILSVSIYGDFIAIGTSASGSFLRIFKWDGISFNRLPDPQIKPSTIVHGVTFSPDGKFLVVTQQATSWLVYRRSGDTFTKLNNFTGIPRESTDVHVAFTPDGKYVFMPTVTTAGVSVFKISGEIFTKLSATFEPLSIQQREMCITPDSRYIVFSSLSLKSGPLVWKINGDDTFTPTGKVKYAKGLSVPSDIYYSAHMSPDGKIIAFTDWGVTFNNSYLMSIFDDGASIVSYINIPDIHARYIHDVKFSPDGKYIYLLDGNRRTIEQFDRINTNSKVSLLRSVSDMKGDEMGIGYAVEDGKQNEIKQIMRLL